MGKKVLRALKTMAGEKEVGGHPPRKGSAFLKTVRPKQGKIKRPLGEREAVKGRDLKKTKEGGRVSFPPCRQRAGSFLSSKGRKRKSPGEEAWERKKEETKGRKGSPTCK